MRHITITTSPYVSVGTVVVMPDYSHPETPYFDFGWGANGPTAELAEVPDGRVVVCHRDDEQCIRDAVVREQEAPKWWLDWQRFENALRRAAEGAGP